MWIFHVMRAFFRSQSISHTLHGTSQITHFLGKFPTSTVTLTTQNFLEEIKHRFCCRRSKRFMSHWKWCFILNLALWLGCDSAMDFCKHKWLMQNTWHLICYVILQIIDFLPAIIKAKKFKIRLVLTKSSLLCSTKPKNRIKPGES